MRTLKEQAAHGKDVGPGVRGDTTLWVLKSDEGLGGGAQETHSPWGTGPESGIAGTWASSCCAGSSVPPEPREASPCTPHTYPPARAAVGQAQRVSDDASEHPGGSPASEAESEALWAHGKAGWMHEAGFSLHLGRVCRLGKLPTRSRLARQAKHPDETLKGLKGDAAPSAPAASFIFV